MQIKQLIIKNIGLHSDTKIDINAPLLLFYGDLRNGKTTILNSVKWVFGGGYPSDIIRHGEKEASISILFENGSITREWYVAKDGATKDRPIIFILDGKPVKKPVDEIKKFLNPFLLDNEHFMKMREQDRKKFMVDLFNVNTSDIDKEQAALEAEGRDLRAKVKAYGDIKLTPVELVDVDEVQSKIIAANARHEEAMNLHLLAVGKIRREHQQKLQEITNLNIEVSRHNSTVDRCCEDIARTKKQIEELEFTLSVARTNLSKAGEWLAENPKKDPMEVPSQPDDPEPPKPEDTTDLTAQLQEAKAQNVRYENYQEALKRKAEKDADEEKLKAIEDKYRGLKKQKIARLAEIDTGGIKDLSFDENGGFVYQGVQAGMLSTSQIMQLSHELSSLYPSGFGLELIDRAESLGKSIYGFIERAEREQKSILATIVGESPADAPETVGVWVVDHGTVKSPTFLWCERRGQRVSTAICNTCKHAERCGDKKVAE